MKQDTKEKMDFGLSQNLESTHPLDERRKFSFVLELYQNDDNVQFEDLYESFRNSHPTYDEQYSREMRSYIHRIFFKNIVHENCNNIWNI